MHLILPVVGTQRCVVENMAPGLLGIPAWVYARSAFLLRYLLVAI